jgi:hypothetical protein
MNDVVFVNVVHCLANLPHEYRAGFFCQNKLVVKDSVEKLAAIDPVKAFAIILNSVEHIFSLHSQFQHHTHHFVVFERIIELNDFRMLQAVHHFNLELDIFAFFSIGHCDEFCR